MAARGMDVLEIFAVALVADGTEPFLHHDLGETDNGIERGADLVADLREKVGLGGGGLFRLALGRNELLLRLLPLGDIAKDHAELICPLADPPDGHEQRDQAALPDAADNLAPAIEQARNAVAGETVEIIVGYLHALGSKQTGERAAGELLVVE